MARSENSKRTDERGRDYRGGPPEDDYDRYGGGGGPGHQEYDYSGGNLKYGTGKYTQRSNDGYQGGVNISRNGRSMQDAVYREDRNNVERARGRPGYGPGMDEMEDPVEGIRDRVMRNRRGSGRGGGGYGYDDDMMDERGYGSRGGIRDRMGGTGLLRDNLREGRNNNNREGGYGSGYYDDDEFNPKVMGGSSKNRGRGYRGGSFDRRYPDYEGYRDDRDGMLNPERGGNYNRPRRGGGGQPSNFDRYMGRDRYDDGYIDDYYAEEDYRRGYDRRGPGESRYRSGRRGGGRRGRYDEDYYEDYEGGRGRGGSDGRDRGSSSSRSRRYDDYRDGYGDGRSDGGGNGDGRSSRDMRR